MRVLSVSGEKDLKQAMRDIRVDSCGIKIMLPKARAYLLKINGINNISANILKQEMLSLGGDVAVARGALTGKSRKTDCLVMGNLSQLGRLSAKLHQQPFGLEEIGRQLVLALKNYTREKLVLDLGGRKLNVGARSYLMGIVNVTPDSFSGDGIYPGTAAEYAEKLAAEGADIIDVGGESSRPGAKRIPLSEELARVIPAVRAIVKKIKTPVSIDTYKPEVARQALDNGAAMINDITALQDKAMAKVINRYKAAVVLMHMRGSPATMQKDPSYGSLIDEIIACLAGARSRALDAGINEEKIIIDPGIGFGKTLEHNLEILKRLKEFKALGRPILAGVSRKAFIGKILDAGPQERISGTIASCVMAAQNGANILRVHDVKPVKQALLVGDLLK